MKRVHLGGGLLIALLHATLSFAQTAQISLQGILLDSGGSPVAGPVTLTFRLYASAEGVAPVFSEQYASVPLSNGVYNVNLGSQKDLSLVDFDRDLWLGIQIGSEDELKPRTQLTGAATARTLTLPTEMTGTAAGYGTATLVLQNLATTGQNYALQVLSGSSEGRAVYGYAVHSSGANFGVYGRSGSTAGVGVRGHGSSATGSTIGVEGESDSGAGIGVRGVAGAGSGSTAGVKGIATASNTGVGVRGEGGAYGVDGWSLATGGRFQGATGIRASGSTLGGLISGLDGLKVSATSDSRSDLILGGLNSLYAVGRISSDPSIQESSVAIESNTGVDIELNADGTGPSGSFAIRNSLGTNLFSVNTGGEVLVGTTVVHGSDRALKEQFRPVDPLMVLEAVAGMPVSRWRYIANDADHIGPMAQDFSAAFGLGSTDRGIAAVDADGVALAAIQGLYQLVQEQQARLAAQELEISRLKATLGQSE